MRWPEREEAAALPDLAGPTAESPAAGRNAPALGAPAAPEQRERRACASAPTARSGPRPRSRSRPRSSTRSPTSRLELSPEDAARLGIAAGDAVEVSQNGTRLNATAVVRTGVPEGTAFLATGIATDSANALTEPTVEVSKP